MDNAPVLVSSEKQFVYHDAYNRGHSQTPRMVKACIGMSPQAKAVYEYIAMFVYEEGKKSYPSVNRIALATGISARRVSKYINEVRDLGFINIIERGFGQTRLYSINDMDKINLLHVSECVWKAVDAIVKDSALPRVFRSIQEALSKLTNQLADEGMSWERIVPTASLTEMVKEDLLKIMEGGTVEVRYTPMGAPPAVKKAPEKDTSKFANGKATLAECTATDFSMEFARLYRGLYNTDVDGTEKDKRANQSKMKRALHEYLYGDKDKMWKCLNAFFDLDFPSHSLGMFTTHSTLMILCEYIETKKVPSFLQRKTTDTAEHLKQVEAYIAEQEAKRKEETHIEGTVDRSKFGRKKGGF